MNSKPSILSLTPIFNPQTSNFNPQPSTPNFTPQLQPLNYQTLTTEQVAVIDEECWPNDLEHFGLGVNPFLQLALGLETSRPDVQEQQ